MSFAKKRNLLLVALLIITVLLYFAPKKSFTEQPENNTDAAALTDISVKLTTEQQQVFDALKSNFEKADNTDEKIKSYQAIVSFFETAKQPLQAGVYSFKLANLTNTATDWISAGDKLHRAANFVPDTLVMKVFDNAITAYQKAIAIEPGNSNAKLKLGVCYVEMGQDPMKGVTLLKEVADSEPKNIEAQLNLGFFSVKSTQYDKAITRFENVLKIDSTFVDAYVYLANTYEMMADTINAIKYYEIYSNKVTDTLVSNQVKNYIKKINNSKN
jgi:tetratricopeptide (TPR) repeat protein